MRIVCMTNEGQLPMMKNMLRSAMEAGMDMSLFHCYILKDYQQAASYNTKNFKSITTRKLEVILHNMKLDSEVLWIDNDIVLFKNCLENVQKYTGTFVMQDDLWSPCTGFFLVRSNDHAIHLIQQCINWLKFRLFNSTVNDQHAFSELYKTYPHVSVTLLPKESYPNGQVYFGDKTSKDPYMVHCNYVVTTAEKEQRLKDHGMWNPTDEAFHLANKYMI